jgi:hypothetical protein
MGKAGGVFPGTGTRTRSSLTRAKGKEAVRQIGFWDYGVVRFPSSRLVRKLQPPQPDSLFEIRYSVVPGIENRER